MTTDPFTVDDVQKARAAYFKSGNGVTTEDWRRALLAGTERLRATIAEQAREIERQKELIWLIWRMHDNADGREARAEGAEADVARLGEAIFAALYALEKPSPQRAYETLLAVSPAYREKLQRERLAVRLGDRVRPLTAETMDDFTGPHCTDADGKTI